MARFENTGGSGDLHQESILVKSGSKYHRVCLTDILYVKAAGNYVAFVTRDKEIMSLMRMKDAVTMLPDGLFIRIHRSFIVSAGHVEVVGKDNVVAGGRSIPVGDKYREAFFERLGRD